MGNGIDIERYKAEYKFLEDKLIEKDVGLLHETENGFEVYYNFRFRAKKKMGYYVNHEGPTRDVISVLFDLISYRVGNKTEEVKTKYDVFSWHTSFIETVYERDGYASSKLKVKISDWYKVLEGVSVEKVRSLMAEYIEKIKAVGTLTKID